MSTLLEVPSVSQSVSTYTTTRRPRPVLPCPASQRNERDCLRCLCSSQQDDGMTIHNRLPREGPRTHGRDVGGCTHPARKSNSFHPSIHPSIENSVIVPRGTTTAATSRPFPARADTREAHVNNISPNPQRAVLPKPSLAALGSLIGFPARSAQAQAHAQAQAQAQAQTGPGTLASKSHEAMNAIGKSNVDSSRCQSSSIFPLLRLAMKDKRPPNVQ